MRTIVLSPSADADLTHIWNYIGVENSNPDAADELLHTIRETLLLLARFPEAGRLSFEFSQYAKHVRMFPVGGFVIFYRSAERKIEVGRIVHSRMHREAAFLKWFLIDFGES